MTWPLPPMEDYAILSTPLTGFVIARWVMAIAGLACFIGMWLRSRDALLRPSIQLALLHHVMFQWPAALFAGWIEENLPQPYVVFIVLDAYLFGVLALVCLQSATTTRLLQTRLSGKPFAEPAIESVPQIPALLVLCGLVVVGTAWYLITVPLTSTGLYALWSSPETATQAREDSLKLVKNPAAVYGFSILRSAVAPMLVLMLCEGLRHPKLRAWLWIPSLVAFPGIAAIVCLPGDRYALVRILLGIGIWWVLRDGLRLRWWQPLCAVLALLPAGIMSLMRESKAVDLASSLDYLWLIIFHRVLATPLEVGLWYLDHAQRFGVFGIAGFERLAPLFGEKPLDTANYIGLTYTSISLDSISAGAGFIFTYYSYLGAWTLVLNLLLTLALDSVLLFYRQLPRNLLAPTMTLVSLALISMVQGDFTTALITHGLIPGVVLAWGLSRMRSPASTIAS